MVVKMIVEVLFMWLIYALYMAILVGKKGPIGGIIFYPKVLQERTVELGLITREELKQRKINAFVLLITLMLVIPAILILFVNNARSYFNCSLQFYVLFLGAEFFDWLFIDTFWVAMSDWWLIGGTEDLNDTWHKYRRRLSYLCMEERFARNTSLICSRIRKLRYDKKKQISGGCIPTGKELVNNEKCIDSICKSKERR